MPRQLLAAVVLQLGIVVVAVAAKAEAVQLLLVWQLVFVVNGTIAEKTKIRKFTKPKLCELLIYETLFVALSTVSCIVCPSKKSIMYKLFKY